MQKTEDPSAEFHSIMLTMSCIFTAISNQGKVFSFVCVPTLIFIMCLRFLGLSKRLGHLLHLSSETILDCVISQVS